MEVIGSNPISPTRRKDQRSWSLRLANRPILLRKVQIYRRHLQRSTTNYHLSKNHYGIREQIVESARSLIGAPAIKYVLGNPEWGQSPEQGFDCSGFVTHVLNVAGVVVPSYTDISGQPTPIRHTNEYWDHFGIAVHHGLQLPGDLIVFSRNRTFPTHIGIVSSEESYIHSTGQDGGSVEESQIVLETIAPQVNGERPLYVTNPIGYKSPVQAISDKGYRCVQKAVLSVIHDVK